MTQPTCPNCGTPLAVTLAIPGPLPGAPVPQPIPAPVPPGQAATVETDEQGLPRWKPVDGPPGP